MTEHLVDGGIGLGRCHRLAHGSTVEPVDDHPVRAQLVEPGQLGRVSRRRCHAVAALDQLRDQPRPDGAGAACDEDMHL
jgi:hypothetical protein